jgi:hypothetical protein
MFVCEQGQTAQDICLSGLDGCGPGRGKPGVTSAPDFEQSAHCEGNISNLYIFAILDAGKSAGVVPDFEQMCHPIRRRKMKDSLKLSVKMLK